MYADHVSEHLNKTCHLAPLRRLADFPGFPQAFVDALLTQDTVDDMVDQVVAHSGDPTWVEGSLFLMQYFKDPSRPHIVSSSEIWSSPFGQAASKWIQQANMKSEGGRMALIAAKGLPISYGIQENTLFRPPSSQEIFDPLHTMPWASSAVDHSQIFEQIKELGGAQDWQSRAHEIMVLWEGDERGFGETVERLVRETMLYQPDWRRNLCNPDDEVPPGPEALFSFQVQGPEVIDYLRRCEFFPSENLSNQARPDDDTKVNPRRLLSVSQVGIGRTEHLHWREMAEVPPVSLLEPSLPQALVTNPLRIFGKTTGF